MTDEQKAKASFNGDWRQVRIFSSIFSSQWYLHLLKSVVIPFSEAYPTTVFWFTRYECDANRPEMDDRGDTDFLALPTTHLAQGKNNSVRLRFMPCANEEAFLIGIINTSFWYSSFLDHNELREFGSPRFCASSRVIDQSYRADIISKLLYAHCLFVLDCIRDENGQVEFEQLQDATRPDLDSFQGIHHLMWNVLGMKHGDIWPTLRLSPANKTFYPI